MKHKFIERMNELYHQRKIERLPPECARLYEDYKYKVRSDQVLALVDTLFEKLKELE